MFKVRVIPCLDVKDGRVVKGAKFRDVRAAGDLVEAAIADRLARADMRMVPIRELAGRFPGPSIQNDSGPAIGLASRPMAG
jgi:hypothetical protein